MKISYAIEEGSADFLAELTVGGHINPHLHEWADARELELWEEFKKGMHDDDYSGWLYEGDAAEDRPADLGYFIGYKISRSYYENAQDKSRAIYDILNITDFGEFLSASGYDGRS